MAKKKSNFTKVDVTLDGISTMGFMNHIKPTYGKMFACNWEDIKNSNISDLSRDIPLSSVYVVTEKRRCQNGNQLSKEKLHKASESNPQTIDSACLDLNDTLVVDFGVTIVNEIDKMAISNNPSVQAKVSQLLTEYIEYNGMDEIAVRIAYNLVSGRHLYRNRKFCTALYTYIIDITDLDNKSICKFNSHHLKMNSIKFKSDDEKENENFQKLVNSIKDVLEGKREIVSYKVYSFAFMGKYAIVHPSQIFSEDQKEKKDNENSKVTLLEKFSDGTARLTPWKIGHAIRTIDTWYDNDEMSPPISVESYGQNTFTGEVKRKDNNDFYTLFDRWLQGDENLTQSDKHYMSSKIIFGFVKGKAKGE